MAYDPELGGGDFLSSKAFEEPVPHGGMHGAGSIGRIYSYDDDGEPYPPLDEEDPSEWLSAENSTLEAEIARRHPRRVEDEYGGRVFSVGRPSFPPPYSSVEMRRILEFAGMQFAYDVNGTVSDILSPDTERLQRALAAQGVSVGLQAVSTVSGTIPSQLYQATIRGRRHPVGTADLGLYAHDTGVDHMPAVIVYGDPLFDLVLWHANDDSLGSVYDSITSNTSCALQLLFGNNMAGFDMSADSILPGILYGHDQAQAAHRRNSSVQLRRMMSNGLDRLGIAHPPIVTAPTE